MSRSWTNNPRGIKDFERSLRKGMTVYVIREHDTRITGQFERYTYSARTCTGRHAITGVWMFSTTSAKYLLCSSADGKVYERPPVGMRDLGGPEPDCRDEGLYGIGRGQELKGDIRDAIGDMEELGRQAEDRARADKKAGRRSWW